MHCIKVASSVSTTENIEFDILGRVARSKQTTDGVEYGGGSDPNAWMTYSYNLSGAMIEQQYPSGRKVQNTIDANGDLEMVKSRKNATSGYWAYANNFTYNAAGAVTSMQLGNGRWESTTFNERLQPTQIALGVTPGATNILDLDYTYGTSVNNGNVLSQTVTVPSVGATPGFTAVQNYSYDSLNRLKQADEKPQNWNDTNCTSDPTKCWKQTFTYDRYGNRRFDDANTTMPASFANQAVTNPTISPNTNKLTSSGWSYDQGGNTKTDPSGRTFTYDAENKQTSVTNSTGTIGQYFYDGDGKRVKKVVPSTGETTVFVYDAGGKLVAEYSTVVATSNDAKVAYLTNDHLASPRINTDANGAVTARHDYHPFGEEIGTSQRTSALDYIDDAVRKEFTGYERDNEINLDYAQARYYNSQHARFTTTDPLLASGRPADPQTWNRFIYVINNPLRYTDPTGLCEAPSGLKAGQVGFCFEAFIGAKTVGVGGLGHGDNRSFNGNDPNATARVTVWSIVSTDAKSVSWTHANEVSPSVVGGGDATISGTATSPDGSQYRVDTGVNTDVALQGTATTGVQVSNIQAKQGEQGFGAGVDVTLSIANGTNGGQQLGRDLQTTGAVMAGTGNPVTGAIVAGAGKIAEAASPGGTIDGNVTLRITGNGNVQYVGGESRGYPSYAVYSYRVGADGKIQTTEHRRRVENKIEDLRKPMTPF